MVILVKKKNKWNEVDFIFPGIFLLFSLSAVDDFIFFLSGFDVRRYALQL